MISIMTKWPIFSNKYLSDYLYPICFEMGLTSTGIFPPILFIRNRNIPKIVVLYLLGETSTIVVNRIPNQVSAINVFINLISSEANLLTYLADSRKTVMQTPMVDQTQGHQMQMEKKESAFNNFDKWKRLYLSTLNILTIAIPSTINLVLVLENCEPPL